MIFTLLRSYLVLIFSLTISIVSRKGLDPIYERIRFSSPVIFMSIIFSSLVFRLDFSDCAQSRYTKDNARVCSTQSTRWPFVDESVEHDFAKCGHSFSKFNVCVFDFGLVARLQLELTCRKACCSQEGWEHSCVWRYYHLQYFIVSK